MTLNIFNHPCFHKDVRHQFGRVHLPVAPKCNIQCNYCNRKYNCANENRPGVTVATLSPQQALSYLEEVVNKDPRITVAGIAGPGDPFANPLETVKTLELVRERFPEMLLCVSTNGLNIAPYINALADLKVSHVTITINAVNPDLGMQIYAWVRDGKLIYRGRAAAELLLERQLQAVSLLKQAGIIVKINSIIIPGINDEHFASIAQKAAELGADLFNCIPLLPTADTVFHDVPEPSPETIREIRQRIKKYLPQMEHCNRCRADAVGLLGEAPVEEFRRMLHQSSRLTTNPDNDRPYVAVASQEGVLVNQHLGEASRLLIFAKTDTGIRLVETRKTPEPGTGKQRWIQLAGIIKDCCILLVNGIGTSPREVLEYEGITIFVTQGLIAEELRSIFEGRNPQRIIRRKPGCGGCSGGGLGCG